MALLSRRYRRILSCNHGYPVGGKFHLLFRIEVGNGLYEADAAHLKQIVRVLPPAAEALDHGEHQPQIPLNELVPGGGVSGPGGPQKALGLLRGEDPEGAGADAADIYFSLHLFQSSCVHFFPQYFPGKEK